MNPAQELHDLGQSIWLDNITRSLLDDGGLRRYIKKFSVTGLTSNPTIFDEAIGGGDAYDAAIRDKADSGKSGEALFIELALEDLRRAADLFRPVHNATDGLDGWVSMEISPLLSGNSAGSISAAQEIHEQADRPNLFIKIPGTPEGIPAIEELIYSGVPVNVTLLFSREQYLAAAEAYLRGIERRIASGRDPKVGSVASIFVSRWDKAANEMLPAELRKRQGVALATGSYNNYRGSGIDPQIAAAVSMFNSGDGPAADERTIAALRNQLGTAVARRTYRAYRTVLASPRWRKLAGAGARPQRLLWASTGTKDPAASDYFYVAALAAPDTLNTMPEKTLHAFADHGELKGVMPVDGGDSEPVLAEFTRAGIDVGALALQLQRDGAKAFVKSWKALLARIAQKSKALSDARRSRA